MNPRPSPAIFALAVLGVAGRWVPASEPPPQPASPAPSKSPAVQPANPTDVDLERRIIDALQRRDWATAESLLKRQIDLKQGGFVPYYNLACCLSMRGDAQLGLDWLIQSIERGFADMFQLRRDGYLAGVRQLEGYQTLAHGWPKFLDGRIERDIEDAARRLGPAMTLQRDPQLRLVYFSGYDEKTTRRAAEEVSLVAMWAFEGALKGLKEAGEADLDAWVVVALPRRDSFMKWLVEENGPGALAGFSAIGGAYSHDDKRLVSQDLGATLRHEFLHALHWRDMARRGFVQPIWIQEGLCSLVEDFDIIDGPGGTKSLRMAESWRTNIAKRRERGGGLVPLDQFVKMPRERFTGSTPLAHYAQARAVFLWLEREGKLARWYREFLEGHDRTGLAALESVFEAKGPELHKKFRAFVRGLPEVPEEIATGKASLGLEVEAGAGDGLTVTGIVAARGPRPRVLVAEKGQIQIGDVIQTIEGRPVRELAEMVRVLGSYEPGTVVELEIRRGRARETVRVKLLKKGA